MRLLAQGWIDSARHLYPVQKIYTFWVNDRAFQRTAGFRMDFLLVSRDLVPRLNETKVDTKFRGRERASDHASTWIAIDA